MDTVVGDRTAAQPMLALFVDVYVARLRRPVRTADVARALQHLGVHCGTNELYDALTRNPAVVRRDGFWHPRPRPGLRGGDRVVRMPALLAASA